jgi:transposase
MLQASYKGDSGMAYPMVFRIAVAAAYDEYGSSIEVAELMGCSESWVRRLIQRRAAMGSLEPLQPKRPDTRKLDDKDRDKLRKLIADKPDQTLKELAQAMDHKASVPTIWRATKAMGLTLKKRPCTPANKTVPMSRKNGITGLRSSRT